MNKKREHRIIEYKLLFTVLVLLIYLVGRELPLMGVDWGYYVSRSTSANNIFLQTISGDVNRCSVLALGISPYMLAGILVQVFVACKKADAKTKVSPVLQNRWKLGITMIFAVVMAVFRVEELVYCADNGWLFVSKCVSILEMIAGALIILWLADYNKVYGIGGQSALIMVNIIDGIRVNLVQNQIQDIVLPIIMGLGALMLMLLMENSEKRIPVQRISIHNDFAEKSYIAIKLNPIGVMPAMFSMAFFMLPQLFCKLLIFLFPDNETFGYWSEQMVITRPLGVLIYVSLLYGLTVFFSVIFLSPRDMTDGLLKQGDCIPGIHAGRDTRRYFMRTIVRLGILSATVMSLCLGLPLCLQLNGIVQGTLVMLPSSIMMLAGISCNLRDELLAVYNLDEYQPFI